MRNPPPKEKLSNSKEEANYGAPPNMACLSHACSETRACAGMCVMVCVCIYIYICIYTHTYTRTTYMYMRARMSSKRLSHFRLRRAA